MKNKNDAISSKHVFDEIGGENIHHFRLRVSSLPPVSKVLLCFIILHCLFLLLYISFMLSFKTGGALPHLTENEAIWLFGMMLAVTAYAIYFSVDGIITENVYQLASFLSTTIIGTVRFVFENFFTVEIPGNSTLGTNSTEEYKYCPPHVFSFCTSTLVITVGFQVMYIVLSPFVYKGFGWRFFQKVAADVGIKAMYTKYQLFLTFLRFDLLFQTLSIITYVVFQFDTVLDIFALVFLAKAISWLVVGWYMVRRESKKLVVLFYATCWVFPTFIIMTSTKTLVDYLALSGKECTSVPLPSWNANWYCLLEGAVSIDVYLLLACVGLSCRVILLFLTSKVYKNFGKGLKEKGKQSTDHHYFTQYLMQHSKQSFP